MLIIFFSSMVKLCIFCVLILLSAIFLLCVMDNIQCKQKDQFPFEEKLFHFCSCLLFARELRKNCYVKLMEMSLIRGM